jgi:hypothetical protein
VLFAVLGILLIMLGWWGARSRGVEQALPEMDKHSVARRARTVRRGGYTCMVLGALFLIASVISVFSGPPPQ